MSEEEFMKQWSAKSVVGAVVGLALGCGGPPPVPEQTQLGTRKQAVLAACPYTTPVISMDKELVIKDLSVVNDVCRTNFAGAAGTSSCATAALGHWSFGYLASQLAGNKNAVDTSTFVLNWLGTWQTDQMVNGTLLPARPGITSLIVNTWRLKSGCGLIGSCTLDFTQAPFRLLAIVNRIDLSGQGNRIISS